MLYFNYVCTHCRKLFRTDISSFLVGASFRCPSCKALFRVVGEAGVVQRIEMETADRYNASPVLMADQQQSTGRGAAT